MKRPPLQRILFLLIVTLCFQSCFKSGGPCEEPITVFDSGIGITFKNTAGQYLYRELFPLYNKDSLKVFDQNGKQLRVYQQLTVIPDSNFLYNEIQFHPVYNDSTDKAAFGSTLCKKFIIQHTTTDKDTIEACFKAEDKRCGSYFENFSVTHNGQMLAAVRNDVFVQVTIIKP